MLIHLSKCFVATVAVMLGSATAAGQTGWSVSPESLEFGDVVVGESATRTLTVTNPSPFLPLVILQAENEAVGFSIVAPAFASGATVNPGETLTIEVQFTPTEVKAYAGDLIVVAFDDVFSKTATLSGSGVEAVDEVLTVDTILEFFDASVADGSLSAKGYGRFAERRLWLLRDLIEFAGELIDWDCPEAAWFVLMVAYDRTDGRAWPPDYAAGPAAAELAELILVLADDLECELCWRCP